METERILASREGGHVARCHTIPHAMTYDVAQHTFNMLSMLDVLHPNPSINLIKAILRHDITERWVGDMPKNVDRLSPSAWESLKKAEAECAKKAGVSMPSLDEEETKWLNALDAIEFWLWAEEEWQGHRNVIAGGYAWRARENLTKMDMPKQCQKFVRGFAWRRLSDDL